MQEIRQNYIENEKKTYENQIKDLKQCLAINKEIVSNMFSANNKPDVAGMVKQLVNENTMLHKMNEKLHEDLIESHFKLLIAK